MKIKNTLINVFRQKKDLSSANIASKRRVKCCDIISAQRLARDIASSIFKKASRKGKRTVIVRCSDFDFLSLSQTALAKIVSQEIFRYMREEKNPLLRIDIILCSNFDSAKFKKTVKSYLEHMVGKLSEGPFVTVDTIIEVKGGIVLIKRSNPPFGWAIPGGFVDYGESIEHAAAREAMEETGLAVRNLRQFHTYSEPGRDPRFHTVTTVFTCRAEGSPKAASDAADAKIFTPLEWRKEEIAFDHKRVLEDYLRYKNRKK